MMQRPALAFLFVFLMAAPGAAQIPVTDPSVTARNAVSAIIKEFILTTQREQREQISRMARRLSAFTDLRKYAVEDPPRWRTHGGDFLFAEPFNEALIFGDPAGAAYLALSHTLVAADEALARLPPAARRDLLARLATLQAADAVAISATHDSGRLRLAGRRHELPAIDALEAHVIDPSNEQSSTAVLGKISGAVLIGARQRQARAQLLAGLVEQLVVDGARARNADAAAMNMQLVTWRDSRAANEAFAAGTGDALRTWRQP